MNDVFNVSVNEAAILFFREWRIQHWRRLVIKKNNKNIFGHIWNDFLLTYKYIFL